jgi:hypothetical protein
LITVGVVAGVAASLATPRDGAGMGLRRVPSSEPLVGLIGADTASAKVVRLDPRTLKPLANVPSITVVGPVRAWALSPDGSHAALASDTALITLDVSRLRVTRRSGYIDVSYGLLWPSDALLVAVGASGIGMEFAVFGCRGCGIAIDTNLMDFVEVPEGVATLAAANSVHVTSAASDDDLALGQMPADAAFDVAVDAAGDRLFVVAATGLVAEVDSLRTLPRVVPRTAYHAVTLPPQLSNAPAGSFHAAWAGNGRIALWGATAGLWLLDTRAWTIKLIDARATDAEPTPQGLLAWTPGLSGVSLYRPDGTLRFHSLGAHSVQTVETSDSFAYVEADGRYSVDLRNGRSTGPLASTAQLVLPAIFTSRGP